MIFSKNKTTQLGKMLNKWTDEECLENFVQFFSRVKFITQFIPDDDGVITHEKLIMVCGDKALTSNAQELEWPVKFCSAEDLEVKVH